MAVVSISMPDELLRRIDGFADEHGYTGRSEVVREGARDLLGEFEDRRLEDRELMGVVTVVFDFETTSVEERMMRLRHEHDTLVASNFHSHVGDHYCMELFILDGTLEEISTFVGKIRATKDTLTVDYSVIPVDDFTRTLAGSE
jgi:CopG family nickel-responsive transcriptional regulator